MLNILIVYFSDHDLILGEGDTLSLPKHIIIRYHTPQYFQIFLVLGNVSGIWVGHVKKGDLKRGKNIGLAISLKQVSMFWYNQRDGLKMRWVHQAFLEYPCFLHYSHSDRFISLFIFLFCFTFFSISNGEWFSIHANEYYCTDKRSWHSLNANFIIQI